MNDVTRLRNDGADFSDAQGSWAVRRGSVSRLTLTLAAAALLGCTEPAPDGPARQPRPLAVEAPATPTLATPAPDGGLLDVLARARFVGEVVVVDVQGRTGTMGTARAEAIWTDVTFQPLRVLLDADASEDAPGHTLTMTFLGGRAGGRVMHVTDAPVFELGDRVVLIADPDQRPWPTWGGAAGVLRVLPDGSVVGHDGLPVVALTLAGIAVGSPAAHAPRPAPTPQTPGASARLLTPPSAQPLHINRVLTDLQHLLDEARR